MQQIYEHSDEHFEVYTTIFSPQVCRSRTRTTHVEAEKCRVVRHHPLDEAEKSLHVMVAVVPYQSRWTKELNLNQGDLVQILSKEDQAWWFGRLKNGDEGYFPAECVEPLQGGASSRPAMLSRRGSVPVVVATTGASCGCTSGHATPKLLRKNSIRRPLGLDGHPATAESGGSPAAHGSPSLLHRVLAKSRRKSCPHIPHPHSDPAGSVNTAFQSD
ncbi:uncharacterized protein [Embiotoca jacksoni]|uniref:uncharacterized protein isoform X1 n=1 Tax=Embiotoca jacksoni TaxID=100190 RepID=UPI003703A566